MTIRIFVCAAFVCGAFIMSSVAVQAQTPLNSQPISEEDIDPLDEEILLGDPSVEPPLGAVSCFDYYTFGSVQANLTTNIAGTVSGAPIVFSGTLVNNNPYPVVDGALYVKVFKSRSDTNDGNGPDVVDQFFVKGYIDIPANGSVPISFEWRIPAYAQSGDYQLATFFTTSRKFNLLGLSFTDDVVGNTVPFQVIGEQTTGVAFDKTGVTVNDEPYYFAAFPPRVNLTESATVEAHIRNTTGSAQAATVSWVIYQWDAQLRENVVQEEFQRVTVPAGGTAPISITVRDTNYPVYLVVGTLQWQDSQSIIGVRFVREGVNRTRINFPSITSFPLVAGQSNTLFSCLHNSGSESFVPNGRLELSLADHNGVTIHEYTYTGDVTGAMMGVASDFTPKRNYDYFTLSARLYQDDEFVDEVTQTFDCNQIDPTLCQEQEQAGFASIFGSVRNLAVLILTLFLLLGILWVYRRVSRKPDELQVPPM
jgi:hypothetical protein